jgi:hypothetical protein
MELSLKKYIYREICIITHKNYMLNIFYLNKAMCIDYFREIPYLELSKLYFYIKGDVNLVQFYLQIFKYNLCKLNIQF